MGAEGSTGPWIVGSIFLKKMGLALCTGSGAPTNGATDARAGKIGVGGTYTDNASGVQWINVGTKAAPVWSPNGSFVSFPVTSANILAMFATPINLIVAPPAGYSIIVNNVLFEMIRTATAYLLGGVVNLVYTGGSVSPHSGTVPAAVVTTAGAATALNNNGPVSAANGIVVPTATGIDITNATQAFTTGTGTMKVLIDYSVVKQ